ncbi:MAG: radical SAM protein [Archaeoglobaceae archaeon]|nr:radical SAM protein [Archaeoglobaceae archaeon]MCX8152026.1 radical SAM protein [Archaeoglobaceae archaeon]MDW8013583.1 radical SAM protein [Archaeoglobaceae archaeon]
MEFNPFAKKYRKGMKRVALLYPNKYVGMVSNVGLQNIYASINKIDDAICERFCLDVFDGLRSVETATPLNEFDLLLVSFQYEMDYFAAVEIAKKFKGLKIAGGPCVMENPEPIKKYFDAFFIGEVENSLADIVKAKSVEELSGIPGIYTKKEDRVKRVYVKIEKHIEKEIIADGAFGRCFLIEIGRGCIRKCRFCIVRQIYSPPRWRKIEDLPEKLDSEKIAIIAPSPTDHPRILDLIQNFAEKGYKISLSSVRADSLNDELAEILSKSTRSITLAPETASQKLLDVVNKGLTDEDIIEAAKVAENRFEKIKLYYLIGLPNETLEDVKKIVEQVMNVKKFVKKVEISVNPLVPKPHTPFQWLPFGGTSGVAELKKKANFIIKECKKSGIDVEVGNIKEFAIQTILSRGDESVSKIFEGGRFKEFDRFLNSIDVDSELPWDFIDHGYSKQRLKKEFFEVIENF